MNVVVVPPLHTLWDGMGHDVVRQETFPVICPTRAAGLRATRENRYCAGCPYLQVFHRPQMCTYPRRAREGLERIQEMGWRLLGEEWTLEGIEAELRGEAEAKAEAEAGGYRQLKLEW